MDLLSPVLIPFLIPLLVVMMMITIQTLLLLIGFGFDVDADADHDIGDAINAADAGGIASHADHGIFDIDHNTAHIDHGWHISDLLSPLGIGKIPLSVIWETYFLGFGISGVTTSFLLSKIFLVHLWFLFITIPIGLVAGWYITKFAAKLIVPLLKTSGIAESAKDLIGRTGKVTSLKVTDKWGEVELNVNGSINHMIVASDGDLLEKNDRIVIVDYDQETKRPIVSRLKA